MGAKPFLIAPHFCTKVGTFKMAPDLKAPSRVCVHFQNQLCTYLDGVLLETNFDPQ